MTRACPILPFVFCPVLQYLSNYFINGTVKIKVIEHKMCVLICLQLLSETLLILRRTEWDMIKYVHQPSCKVFLSDFNETWSFLDRFSKNRKYQISWKSDQWEQNCSWRTDRRIDMTKLIVAFRSYANVPINEFSCGIRITTCVCVCVWERERERERSRDEFQH